MSVQGNSESLHGGTNCPTVIENKLPQVEQNKDELNLDETKNEISNNSVEKTHRSWLRRGKAKSIPVDEKSEISAVDDDKTEDLDIKNQVTLKEVTQPKHSHNFKNKLHSLFRKDHDPVVNKNEENPSSVSVAEGDGNNQQSNLVEPDRPSSRWRYRLRNNNANVSQVSLSRTPSIPQENIVDDKDTEIFQDNIDTVTSSKFCNKTNETKYYNEVKRQTNLKTLEDEVFCEKTKLKSKVVNNLGDMDIDTDMNSDYDVQSNSSSIERATKAKEKCSDVFSPQQYKLGSDIQYESPLTPQDENDSSHPYKHVFETPRQYSIINPSFDNLIVDNNSNVNNILSDIFDALKINKNLLFEHNNANDPKIPTLSSILTEVLNSLLIKLQDNSKLEEDHNLLKRLLKKAENDLIIKENQLKRSEDQISVLTTGNEELLLQINKAKNVMIEISQLDPCSGNSGFDSLSDSLFDMLPRFYDNVTNVFDSFHQLQSEFDSLSKKSLEIQTEHKNLILELETSQEKVITLESKLSDSNKLQAETTRRHSHNHALPLLRRTNEKLQLDYQRERSKVLDLRKEHKNKDKFLKAYEVFRSESLQFMIYLMHSFRSFAKPEAVVEYDRFIKVLNEFYYNNNLLKEGSDNDIESKCEKFTDNVVSFYRDIAKAKFLDQLLEKYLSFMLSNEFLSTTIAGLRKQNHDYEQYANHLLQKLNDVSVRFQSDRN